MSIDVDSLNINRLITNLKFKLFEWHDSQYTQYRTSNFNVISKKTCGGAPNSNTQINKSKPHGLNIKTKQ